MITQQETVTHCLLLILQPIYLDNLSPHKCSQAITLRIYQWPLYLLTNQITHQGFLIFNWLRLSLDSEDGFRTGCRNVSCQQQSFSGLQSPKWSFLIKVCYSWISIKVWRSLCNVINLFFFVINFFFVFFWAVEEFRKFQDNSRRCWWDMQGFGKFWDDSLEANSCISLLLSEVPTCFHNSIDTAITNQSLLNSWLTGWNYCIYCSQRTCLREFMNSIRNTSKLIFFLSFFSSVLLL